MHSEMASVGNFHCLMYYILDAAIGGPGGVMMESSSLSVGLREVVCVCVRFR